MARRPNQVSIPNPEFGVDFDASARAMHQSASKGSLMVHESTRFGAAALGKSSEATMFERNTMLKTLKRKIALVAVAALGAGGLAVIGAPAANAANNTYTGATVAFSGVRVTTTGTTLDAVPLARATITIPASAIAVDFIRVHGAAYQTFTLTSAPSASARVLFANAPTSAATAIDFATPANPSADANARYLSLSGTATNQLDILNNTTQLPTTATNTYVFFVAASVAGTYAGTLETRDADGDKITGSWTFTTTGVPATVTATAAATEVVSGGSTTVAVAVRDANSNPTQIGLFDTVSVTPTLNGTAGSATNYTYAQLFDSTESFAFTGPGVPGSTNTVKATPLGTLASLASSTATITENSTVIDTTAITAGLVITAPSDALVANATQNTAQAVRPNSSTITVQITAPSAGTFGKIFRLKGVVQSGGTITGTLAGAASTEAYVDITTSATTGKGTGTFTIGGASLLDGKTLIITQANAALGTIGTLNTTITQTAPTFAAANNVFAPSGNIVAKLGDTTSVTVEVDDQFGKPLGAGYTVYAYRGATTGGTFLGQATTGADGTAKVNVTSVAGATAGAVEVYTFNVVSPTGTAQASNSALTITYSATGGITSLSMAPGAGITGAGIAATRANTATAAETVLPVINTPITAGAAAVNDIQTDRIYTVATGVIGGTAGATANAIQFSATATPTTTVSWTGSAGVKFVTTSPETTAVAWNGGTTTATGATVYAFSTKAGLNTVTATSGGLTVTRSFWVEAAATEYYNIAVSPATLSLDPGAYSVVTVTVTDAFGNPVDTTGNAVAVAATGSVLLGGFASSALIDTGSDGTAKVTVIANNTGGTGTVTFTNNLTAGAWAAAYVTPTGATAPVKSASVAATVKTASSVTNPAIDAVKTDVKAVSDTVATLSKAVTTVQSSVTELTSTFATQIKNLTDAIAKISAAIAAIQKSLKKK